MKCNFTKINFGYTQVLFMGSVPRINCHLAVVPLTLVNIKYIHPSCMGYYTQAKFFMIIKVTSHFKREGRT
jgi:hypothetical protein